MRHVYVYYRVDPAHAEQTAARVESLFAGLRAYCATPPRRTRRCDDAATWMEIYEGIADHGAFMSAMHAAVRTLALDAVIPGGRHIECFVDAAPRT